MAKQSKQSADVVNSAIVLANQQVAELAAKYSSQLQGAVGKLQLEYAMKARAIVDDVPDADVTPLVKAFGRQRKAEIGAVIAASDSTLMAANELFPKNRKPGLQQMARAIALVLFDGPIVDGAAASLYLGNGKKDDFFKATGQTPEPLKTPDPIKDDAAAAAADTGTQTRDTERTNPSESEVGNLKRMLELQSQIAALLPAYEKEMATYGPECKKAVQAHVKALKATQTAAEAVNAAAANG